MTPIAPQNLSPKELRKFAFVLAGGLILIFGLFFPLVLGRAIPRWPWILGGIFLVWGFISPKSLKPIYKLWMRIGLVLGAINSRIILGIVYYIGVVPLGLLMKLKGHDPMSRNLDKKAASYRVPSEGENLIKRMEKPF